MASLAPSRSEISRAWCACACRHTRHRQRSAGSSQGLALAVALIVALLYQGRLVQSIPYTRISILAQYTAMRYIVPRSPPDAHAGEPHQMKLPQPLSLRIAPVVFAAVVVAGCGQTPPSAPPPSGPVHVGAYTVQAQALPLITELPGRTSAYRVAEVRPQVSGILQRSEEHTSELQSLMRISY